MVVASVTTARLFRAVFSQPVATRQMFRQRCTLGRKADIARSMPRLGKNNTEGVNDPILRA